MSTKGYYYNSTGWKKPIKHIESMVLNRAAFGLKTLGGKETHESPCGWIQNFWFHRELTPLECEQYAVEPDK